MSPYKYFVRRVLYQDIVIKVLGELKSLIRKPYQSQSQKPQLAPRLKAPKKESDGGLKTAARQSRPPRRSEIPKGRSVKKELEPLEKRCL